MRADAQRIFENALDAARDGADAATLAEIHFQAGLMREVQWLRRRDWRITSVGRPPLDPGLAAERPRYAWEYIQDARVPEERFGAEDRLRMVEHFRAAMEAWPGHAGAAVHLAAYLHEEEAYEALLEHARAFLEDAPGEPRAHLALGLALYDLGRIDEAAGAFLYALSLMPHAEQARFEEVAELLHPEQEKLYLDLEEAARREWVRRFWGLADPLLLTEANEAWIEHMARMTYADFRFGVEEYRLRGWDTDKGVVWLRYGPPAVMMGGSSNVWSYGPEGPVFFFGQSSGFREARGDDWMIEDIRWVRPAQLVPSFLEGLSIPVQVARFRGDGGRIDVEVHARVPLDSLDAGEGARLRTGLFVLDAAAREVEAQVYELAAELATPGLESWRLTLPSGIAHRISVEAAPAEVGEWAPGDPPVRVAVGRGEAEPSSFPPGELGISDLLMADLVRPLHDSARARSEFHVQANPAMEYASGDPIHLYFELYNLLPDAEGYVSYDLELEGTILELDRSDEPRIIEQLAELADKWGLTAEGTAPAQLRFSKSQRVLARDAVAEWFEIEIPDAPSGRYSFRVTVRDANGAREATAMREIRVVPAARERVPPEEPPGPRR